VVILVCPAGNGFIEGKELESFFKELEETRRGAGVVSGIIESIYALHR